MNEQQMTEAAPEMLAALEAFVESFSESGEFNNHSSEYSIAELRQMAVAAIEKATGETQ